MAGCVARASCVVDDRNALFQCLQRCGLAASGLVPVAELRERAGGSVFPIHRRIRPRTCPASGLGTGRMGANRQIARHPVDASLCAWVCAAIAFGRLVPRDGSFLQRLGAVALHGGCFVLSGGLAGLAVGAGQDLPEQPAIRSAGLPFRDQLRSTGSARYLVDAGKPIFQLGAYMDER